METQDLALIEEAVKLAEQYGVYNVKDNASLVVADQDLSAIKKQRNAIEEARLKLSRKMDETKRDVMKPYVDAVSCLDKVRSNINSAMSEYKREQESIRQEQERKLQELARKEEEKKKKTLEERAKKAEEAGNAAKAEELRNKKEDIFVPVPVVVSNVVETKNKPRDVWKYRITDIKLVPREWLIENDTLLGKQARTTHDTLAIPGVEFYKEDSKF